MCVKPALRTVTVKILSSGHYIVGASTPTWSTEAWGIIPWITAVKEMSREITTWQICFCPKQLQPRWQAGEHTTLTNYHAVIGPEFS
jgi:hypothetical protein